MGLFITVEGGEGCGKSTISKLVADRLMKEGYKVALTREPGGVVISEKIREVILSDESVNMDGTTEALLFAASRRQHVVEKLKPLLADDYIVISDRFVDSSLVYQGIMKNVGIEKVYNMNLVAMENYVPNRTILFDLDPEEGQRRIFSNSSRDVNRFDRQNMDFHYKLRDGYLKVASMYSDRIKIIDASKNIEEVTESMYKLIKELL